MKLENNTMRASRVLRIISILLFGVLLSGCATAGKNFDSSHAQKIKLNSTTEQEIVNWFGNPHTKTIKDSSGLETTAYSYKYAKVQLTEATGRVLVVEVKDGMVYSYYFRSSMPEDSTDFDVNLRKRLEIGHTTMADTVDILGAPGGKYQLPTQLLLKNLCEAAPKKTSVIWVYEHVATKAKRGVFKNHIKTLALYFDTAGILQYVEFSETGG